MALIRKLSEAPAKAMVDGGVRDSMRKSPQQLAQVAGAREAIERPRHSFEDMAQHDKTRFAMLPRHNQQLSADIAEVLGQTQHRTWRASPSRPFRRRCAGAPLSWLQRMRAKSAAQALPSRKICTKSWKTSLPRKAIMYTPRGWTIRQIMKARYA